MPTKEELDAHFAELTKHEERFCEVREFEMNAHGVYDYRSSNELSRINLPLILVDYKQWLIQNNIVQEVKS